MKIFLKTELKKLLQTNINTKHILLRHNNCLYDVTQEGQTVYVRANGKLLEKHDTRLELKSGDPRQKNEYFTGTAKWGPVEISPFAIDMRDGDMVSCHGNCC